MSEYPVLDNRSIDQWKVTELKEELKKRKLTTRGLKDDLFRRLKDALHIERENAEKADIDPELIAGVSVVEMIPINEATEEFVDHGNNVDDVVVHVDISDSIAARSVENVAKTDIMSGNDSNRIEDKLVAHATIVEDKLVTHATAVETNGNNEVSGIVASESVVIITKQDLQTNDSKENGHLKLPLEAEDFMHHVDNEGSMTNVGYEESILHVVKQDLKHRLEDESSKLQREDPVLVSSAPDNQVSEVSSAFGFRVISDSISNDTMSMSTNEKIELKDVNPVSEVTHALVPQVRPDSIFTDDALMNETIEPKNNIYPDDVKLELNVVNLEMVGPSSSPEVQVGGKSHTMDVEKPYEKKALIGDNNVDANSGVDKKIDSADVGYSEKLKFYSCSGDDSMEDLLETMQIYSEYNPNGMGNTIEKNEVPSVKEGCYVDVIGNGLSCDRKDLHCEQKNHPALSSEKRKVHDQLADGIQPVKRQRRWNSNNANLSEPESSNLTPAATPNYSFQPSAVKQNIRSDPISGEEAPKQRIVPSSPRRPSTSLRIDNFLRPFTLKAVQELLGKTGTIDNFWMDHIKTHCYVTYSTVEEAVETRNAVYNLQWPPNGGRFLAAEFVDTCEVKMKVEAPHIPTASTAATPFPSAPPTLPASSFSQQSRQQLAPSTLPPPPPLPSACQAIERLPPPPPPVPDKLHPPVVTLDDLFRKTKATPWIYYLPLSEELVAEKYAAHGKNSKI